MNLASIQELLRRPWMRVLVAAVGLGLLAGVIALVGVDAVLKQLSMSAPHLPLLGLLELCIVGCNISALRALYDGQRAQVPPGAWLRAALLGYVVGIIVPLGRAAAEASRAVVLTSKVGGPRAAVAAVQMQGVALMANAGLSLTAAIAAYALLGISDVSALILGNAALALTLGLGILVARKRASPGRLLGQVHEGSRHFGLAFDATLGARPKALARALAWESSGRMIQAIQCAFALKAVGHGFHLVESLATQGALLVGATLGDAFPAQLGASEAGLVAAAARGLALLPAQAATIAMLLHSAQLGLALLFSIVLLVLPSRATSQHPVAEMSR